MKETTYPGGGTGDRSPRGTVHSYTTVSGRSSPLATSSSNCAWVTVERIQYDMANERGIQEGLGGWTVVAAANGGEKRSGRNGEEVLSSFTLPSLLGFLLECRCKVR